KSATVAAKTVFKQIVKEGLNPPLPKAGDTPQNYCESLRGTASDVEPPHNDEPPPVVVQAFPVTIDQWNALSDLQQQELVYVAERLIQKETISWTHDEYLPNSWIKAAKTDNRELDSRIDPIYTTWGQGIIAYADRKLESMSSAPGTGS